VFVHHVTTGVDTYLSSSVVEINTTIYDGFVTTEVEVFAILDSIPTESLVAIDNATGLIKTLTDLETFADSLPALQV